MERARQIVRISTVAGFGCYSLLVGYLIVNRLQVGLFSLVLITLGMGCLFLVTNHGLRKEWPDFYDRRIRWTLTGALLAGWALGVWVDENDWVMYIVVPVLVGAGAGAVGFMYHARVGDMPAGLQPKLLQADRIDPLRIPRF